MTLYTNTKNTSSVPPRIISVDEIGRIRRNDWVIFCNRESTTAQSHQANVAVLRVVHRQLGCKQPFASSLYKRTANGSVAGASSGSPYFIRLGHVLRAGLSKLGANGTLYAVFVTRGRIFRPPGYEKDDTRTWNPTQADYDAFGNWLYRCFGHNADRIVFAVVFDTDGAGDRRIESDIGANLKAQRKVNERQVKRIRERLRLDAERLSAMGLNAGEILRHFERMLEPWMPHINTIRDWARNAGTEKRCGKRKLTKCKNYVNYMGGSALAKSTLIPLLLRDESDVDSSQGYIRITPHITTPIPTHVTTQTIPIIPPNNTVIKTESDGIVE